MSKQLNWAHFIAMQAGVVPLSFGSPGAAKTALHRGLANATGREFVQCILRQMMPEDIGGIPIPHDFHLTSGKVPKTVKGVKNLLPEFMLRAHHEPTVLLLDEFNHAGHDVMGAAQELINDPPPMCWMAACANPVEQSTSGVELAPPVVNRMCILQWETPVDEITAGWASGFKEYPTPDFPIVSLDYLDVYGKYWGEKLCTYKAKYPDAIEHGFPKDPAEGCNPFCSWRSLTNVGLLMAACDSVGANWGTRSKLVNGCIGNAATSFLDMVKSDMLPDPEELLAKPSTLKLPPRFDRVRAIYQSVLSAVKNNNTAARWERAYDLAEIGFDQNAEASMAYEAALNAIKPKGHMPTDRKGNAEEMRKLRTAAAS